MNKISTILLSLVMAMTTMARAENNPMDEPQVSENETTTVTDGTDVRNWLKRIGIINDAPDKQI